MYFVTAMEDLKNGNEPFGIRTVGFYSKFEDAEYTVLNNICDINETTYDYAIIEELGEGLYPYSESSFLYKFDYSTEKYIPASSEDVPLNMVFTQVG